MLELLAMDMKSCDEKFSEENSEERISNKLKEWENKVALAI